MNKLRLGLKGLIIESVKEAFFFSFSFLFIDTGAAKKKLHSNSDVRFNSRLRTVVF